MASNDSTQAEESKSLQDVLKLFQKICDYSQEHCAGCLPSTYDVNQHVRESLYGVYWEPPHVGWTFT